MIKRLLFFLLWPLFLFAQQSDFLEIKKAEDLLKEIEEESKKIEQEKPKNQEQKLIEKIETEVFNEDFLLEKRKNFYYLWIRKKAGIESVILTTHEEYIQSASKFYLRAKTPIPEQKEAIIIYKNRKIGYEHKVYLLTTSAVQKHPIFQEAFCIIIPETTVYGIEKTYAEMPIILGETKIKVRLFSQKYCQGSYIEKEYLFYPLDFFDHFPKKIHLLKQEQQENNIRYFFCFESPFKNLEEITLIEEKEEKKLFSVSNPAFRDKRFSLDYWIYDADKRKFLVYFNLNLEKSNKKMKVLVKDKKETIHHELEF